MSINDKLAAIVRHWHMWGLVSKTTKTTTTTTNCDCHRDEFDSPARNRNQVPSFRSSKAKEGPLAAGFALRVEGIAALTFRLLSLLFTSLVLSSGLCLCRALFCSQRPCNSKSRVMSPTLLCMENGGRCVQLRAGGRSRAFGRFSLSGGQGKYRGKS